MTTASSLKTILVVDDDKAVTTLLENLLTKQGFKVVLAHDGLDAMVMVKKTMPDLIILDIMMPEINGYDVCRDLKFDPKFKHIPIIVFTSRERELDPRIGDLMGIDYTHKPIGTAVLLEKIKKSLKEK